MVSLESLVKDDSKNTVKKNEYDGDILKSNLEELERIIKNYANRTKAYEKCEEFYDGFNNKRRNFSKLSREKIYDGQKILKGKRAKKNAFNIEKKIRYLSRGILERVSGFDIDRFIGERKFSKYYKKSLKSRRCVFYHNDLDGIVSSSLVSQYSLERFDDLPKLYGISYGSLLYDILIKLEKRGDYLEEVFLLDIGTNNDIKDRISSISRKLIIITDKECEKTIEKNFEDRIEIVINFGEDNKSTGELTYAYLRNMCEGFKGKNVERLLELSKMGHRKKADEEAKTIQRAIELIPYISDLLVLEFAENGAILDYELWRFLDCCSSVARGIMKTISRSYETLYEDDRNLIISSPLYFFSNLILAEMRKNKGKNVIGIISNGDEITLIGRYKNIEDVNELEDRLREINLRAYRYHPDYVVSHISREYEDMLLDLFREYSKSF